MLKQFLEWRQSGEKTARDLLEICLRRISECDEQIQAWVRVKPIPATGEGPLSGIPFGAKDIFDTADFPTEYGSDLFRGRQTGRDAALVADLRGRGAVLLGKTRTTGFAYFDPAATRNPRNLSHTPGGSSSGSAAAVAAGMVPFALGSQTQGSVLRPASYCGVTGFKPTFGLLPTSGSLPFAPSLDTAGLFTETAEDMQALWTCMGFGDPVEFNGRIGALAADFPCEPEMRDSFWRSITELRANGLAIDSVEPPPGLLHLTSSVKIVNDYEGARSHESHWHAHGLKIGEKLAALIERGLAIPERHYQAALRQIDQTREQMTPLFAEYAVLASPAATGAAPEGLASTGNPAMNSAWTALGVPAISVPMRVNGLPLGMQLNAARNADSVLLGAAVTLSRGI